MKKEKNIILKILRYHIIYTTMKSLILYLDFFLHYLMILRILSYNKKQYISLFPFFFNDLLFIWKIGLMKDKHNHPSKASTLFVDIFSITLDNHESFFYITPFKNPFFQSISLIALIQSSWIYSADKHKILYDLGTVWIIK